MPMKGVSNYVSAIILLFILITLFPIIYSTYRFGDVSRKTMVSEALSATIKRGEIRLSFKRLDQYRFIAYNYGIYGIQIEKVFIDGEPTNVTILLYDNGGWIQSDAIPPTRLFLLIFDKPVDSFITLVLNGTLYSIHLGE